MRILLPVSDMNPDRGTFVFSMMLVITKCPKVPSLWMMISGVALGEPAVLATPANSTTLKGTYPRPAVDRDRIQSVLDPAESAPQLGCIRSRDRRSRAERDYVDPG